MVSTLIFFKSDNIHSFSNFYRLNYKVYFTLTHALNTSSLSDLAKFIQDADGGLMQPVVEGDYEVLVSVMGYLYNVKERQATTDEMFQPLTDTIQLLKYYDMELPEEVNVLLQV